MNDRFDFQIPGLSEREDDVADAFVHRMHEIAESEGTQLDLWRDGGPILTRLVAEILSEYSLEQKVQLMLKILEGISGVLSLHKQDPKGSA